MSLRVSRKIPIVKRICAGAVLWRKHTGYSQMDIAKDLGMEPSAVSRFERGITFSGYILAWYVTHGFSILDWCGKLDWRDSNG